MRATRRIRVMAVAAVIACSLAACSNSASNTDSFVNWDQINQEYHDTVVSFPYPLPTGVDFPAETTPPSEDNQLYERGWGEMQAYLFAECAYHSIVVANEAANPDAALAALDRAEEIHSSVIYQSHYSDHDGIWEGVITKARLGDYSVFNQFYETDCVG